MDYQAFLQLSLEEIQAIGDELVQRPLTTATIEKWLRDWADLAVLYQESFARLAIATHRNTADDVAREKLKHYRETIWPVGGRFDRAITERLFEHEAILPESLLPTIAKMKKQQRLNSSDKALELQNQEYALIGEYDAPRDSQTIEWKGQTLSARQARALLSSTDAAEREAIAKTLAAKRKQDYAPLTEIWGKLLDIRQAIAEENGFSNYLDFRWQEFERNYSPEDSRALHAAIKEHFSPLFARMMQKKQKALGLESIKAWDVYAPISGENLKPFTEGEALVSKVGRIFQRLDSDFSDVYQSTLEQDFLDIAMRTNTWAVGGFSRAVGRRGAFVMLNVTGKRVDVENLVHEMGHSIAIVASCKLPYHLQWGFAYDFSETPSSAMEILSMPYWDEFYRGAELEQAKREYFEEMVWRSLNNVIMEAFQIWAYSNREDASEPAKAAAKWLELHQDFMPNVDWLSDEEMPMAWLSSGSPFDFPIFSMEYVYGRMAGLRLLELNDMPEAVRRYKAAIALGNSAGAGELFAAMGMRFFPTAADVAEAAQAIAARLGI